MRDVGGAGQEFRIRYQEAIVGVESKFAFAKSLSSSVNLMLFDNSSNYSAQPRPTVQIDVHPPPCTFYSLVLSHF